MLHKGKYKGLSLPFTAALRLGALSPLGLHSFRMISRQTINKPSAETLHLGPEDHSPAATLGKNTMLPCMPMQWCFEV